MFLFTPLGDGGKKPRFEMEARPGLILNFSQLKIKIKIMKKLLIRNAMIAFVLFSFNSVNAQNVVAKQSSIVAWDGMMVAGYVNQGSYVNFGGPSIKLIIKPWSFGFGILPTMRIKEDKVAKEASKNSIITPTAGFGFTFAYRHLVLQVPFYYNAKTTASNGKWNPGVGIGFKF